MGLIHADMPIKKATLSVAFGHAGGSGEIRTRDQWIKSPLLYQLSYRPGGFDLSLRGRSPIRESAKL
jgi:hypothetical protein